MMKLKNILLEGRYDQIIRTLSGDILDAIKNKEKEYSGYFSLENNTLVKRPQIDVDLDIIIKYNKSLKWSHNIAAEGDEDVIEAVITVNPKFLPMAYNDLLAEIKEMLRHEIEHITQLNFKKGKVRYQDHGDITYKEYLLLRHEIPAFVQGLNKRAKTKKITLTQAFDEFYEENKLNFSSHQDWQDVKSIWAAWAKKKLPNVKL